MSSLSVRVLGGGVAACLAGTAFMSAAVADGHQDPVDGKVVATGLNSPRHLTVAPNGDVYVAEAGTGGDDCVVLGEEGPVLVDGVLLPCGSWDPEEHPEWGEIRLGDTGSITKVSRKGGQQRVVTGLPAVDLGGGEATGPSDVSIRGNKLMITIGLGAAPEDRDMMVELFDNDLYAGLATVQQAKFTGSRVTLTEQADLAQFEAEHNPHASFLDTNPNAISADGNGWLLADAGGNDVMRLDHKGDLSLVAVLQDEMVDAPPFLGLPPGTQFPMEPVPTSVERGPDGATYVSQLTGFPFPVGGSSIWRVAPDGSMTQWATGLTNVTDLAFGTDGSLYAVQLANNGLLSGDMTGSLVKVVPGLDTHEVIADGMFAPYGVAVHHDTAYVTTGTVVAGGGAVVRFNLDD